jgi:hypothetical protein
MQLRKARESAHAKMPAAYKRPGFYLIALATAAIAGGLAVVEGADKPLLAFQIGVAAPLILDGLSTKPPTLPPTR